MPPYPTVHLLHIKNTVLTFWMTGYQQCISRFEKIIQFVSLYGHEDSKVYFSYFKIKITSLGFYRLFFYISSDHLGCKIQNLVNDTNLEIMQ